MKNRQPVCDQNMHKLCTKKLVVHTLKILNAQVVYLHSWCTELEPALPVYRPFNTFWMDVVQCLMR